MAPCFSCCEEGESASERQIHGRGQARVWSGGGELRSCVWIFWVEMEENLWWQGSEEWQADGGAPFADTEDPPASPTSSSPPAVSTVTDAVTSPAGLDAVVPDAGIVERNCRSNAAEQLKKVQEELDEKNARWRSQIAATSVAASGSNCRDNMSTNPVELQIRCAGYPTMKGTFSAGSALKEVRDFVRRELRPQQLQQQPLALPDTNRLSRRTPRSNGISALLPSDRVTQRTRKMSRYADPSSSVSAPRNPAVENMYFLIPFPRTVFDTEASMETTLFDANLYPRGILTVQFQTKEDPSTSDHVNTPHEFSSPLGEGVQARDLHTCIAQPSGDHHVSRHAEDVAKREQRLKATLDRYSSEQDSRIAMKGVLETPVAATFMLAPRATSAAVASSMSEPRGREERTLEMDGERVRHRELALQAAARRMSEAAQMFRDEVFTPDGGEPGGVLQTPSDVESMPATTSHDDLTREDQESKGKQVADCGPSAPIGQPAEVRVHDVGSNFAGFRGRFSRARLPLPGLSPSRPEKMQRIDEASSTSSAAANYVPPLFASGHAIERARRRDETSPSERWIRGSPGSGSSSVSELRIRLEDGSVLRHTFPSYTTLQSVCEFAIPGRFSTAEYGLILPIPGSHFYEGEALGSTLEEVGLVPSGVVHLQKVASRGLVTQGRRRARRMIRYLQNRNEPEPELEQLWQDFSRHMNTNLTYEELVELEDSIGRVNVGVPEATIANLPTHTVSRSAGDNCVVCLSEMVEGEEVMLLPCLHTFHPACIRQWLLQSTCCPTCKHYIT